jgi:hypothetical protein
MSRRIAFPALLLALCLPGPPASAEGGEARTFDAKNFRMTLPDEEWSFEEVTSAEQGAGYVVAAEKQHGSSFARVMVRVVPTSGLPLADLVKETGDGLRANLTAPGAPQVRSGRLSGLEGREVLVKGRLQDHDAVHWAISIEQGGTFHQLVFTLLNGAETRMAEELDALRRGYRLLKGSGPEEAASTPDFSGLSGGGGAAPVGGATPAPGEGEEEAGSASDWPAGGPRLDGRTIHFPTHNLRWTLPEGSPFRVRGVTEDETQKEGFFLSLEASAERKRTVETEPAANQAEVQFVLAPAPPGFDAKRLVADPGLQNQFGSDTHLFDKVNYGSTKTFPEIDIGNHKGSAIQLVGAKEGAVRYFRLYVTSLKDVQYEWRVLLTGGREVNDVFTKDVNELVKGIEFVDTSEPVKGPVGIAGIFPHGSPRGHGSGQEQEVSSVGVKGTKPAPFAVVNNKPAENDPSLRIAWEARSPDGQAYLYVDVQSFQAAELDEQRRTDEDLVKTREGQWLETAADPRTVTRGRDPFFKARFGREKALGWEFRGTLHGIPFVEYGYVFKVKRYVFVVRFQFGGAKAEEAMAELAKDAEKALKLG